MGLFISGRFVCRFRRLAYFLPCLILTSCWIRLFILQELFVIEQQISARKQRYSFSFLLCGGDYYFHWCDDKKWGLLILFSFSIWSDSRDMLVPCSNCGWEGGKAAEIILPAAQGNERLYISQTLLLYNPVVEPESSGRLDHAGAQAGSTHLMLSRHKIQLRCS